MSFWPRLRKRSRGRKRSVVAKTNPYATRDVDKYAAVQADHEAQRARFAAENGVPASVVRFISQSSRGWVCLREEDTPDSSPLRSPDDDPTCRSSPSDQFSHPPPSPPLAIDASLDEDIGTQESSSTIAGADDGTAKNSAEEGNAGRLILSGQDEARTKISKTASVLFVKVLVFSRALGASKAFAFTVGVVVDSWNRGKATFQQVFSVVASRLLSTLRPYLSLHTSKAIPPMRAARPQSPVVASNMKVSPITESSDTDRDELLRSSSFAFPVLKRDNDSDMSAPLFPQNQPLETPPSSPVVEIEEMTVLPLKESNKLAPTKHCQKLRSKLFKGSPARKSSSSSAQVSGENSSGDAELSTGSAPGSPAVSSKRSFMSRKSKKVKDVGEDGSKTPESELKPPKVTRSHELLFFRSPQRKGSSTESSSQNSPKSVSRSQELRFSLRSFGKKKVSKSQELQAGASSPPPSRDIVEDFALPSSTVEGLQALAFPFKDEEEASSSPQRQASSTKLKEHTKRRTSLGKLMAVESMEEVVGSKSAEPGPSSPYASSKPSKSSKGCFVERTVAELKPGLKKVRTSVSLPSSSESQTSELRKMKSTLVTSRSTPLPSQRKSGELGRSQLLGADILGALLLLSVLGFLLLGRIPAILGTACFCLVLSHVQAFFARNMTQRDKELLLLRRSSGIPASRQGSPDWQTYGGSPLHEKADFQSSEYRKRVLMEGLLERGNRRGTP